MPIHADFSDGDFDSLCIGQALVLGMRSGFISGLDMHDLTSLCVERLRLVPLWLTPRHTSTHTDSI